MPGPPLWQKSTVAADWVTRFTVGDDWRWDTLLLPYDLTGTEAHAWGLAQIGILTEDELARLQQTLGVLRAEHARGDLAVRPEDEDCHTVIEHALTERLGDVGKKIHTGRSRNDQVLTALRLFLKDHLAGIGGQTDDLARRLCDMGARHERLVMPGYTHLQRAMPTTVGLWALAYAELLAGDLEALRTGRAQIDLSPLGSAAGYGVPHLSLPRRAVAERLGFADLQLHVPAVQLTRGKSELHVVHALVQVGATINRLASDLVLFAASEFGFVRLPEAYTTGSSIMPQKRNPDVLELARASYHRLVAELQVLLTLPANLPSGYHRDLQLTKEAVMRSTLLCADVLEAMRRVLPGLSFDEASLRAATSPELFATAEALRRVLAGTPFREAYRAAAAATSGLDVPDEPLAPYVSEGMPGRGDPDAILRRLARHAHWIEQPA